MVKKMKINEKKNYRQGIYVILGNYSSGKIDGEFAR